MVSQFGSLGYTIMGKTADLTVVQKTIIDTLHKEGKPQTFIAKDAGCSHRPSCLKSSVKFPQSVMFWGAMSSAGVGPLCFLKTNVTAPVYQDILEHFMLPSADQLFKDDFIFQQDLGPVHTAKSTKSWLNDHVLVCLTGQQTHQTWTPSRIYGVLSRGKWETRDQKMQMNWRPLSKKHGLPAVPQTDHLHATPNWGSN